MKPGKNDIDIKRKISGRQLEELQKHTWQMCEAFGLDKKDEGYTKLHELYVDLKKAYKETYGD